MQSDPSRRTPRDSVPIERDDEGDIATGRVDLTPDEIAEIRADRPMPLRIGHLEERVDGVVASIGGLEAKVAQELSDVKTKVAEEFGDMKQSFGELAGAVRGLETVVKDDRALRHIKVTTELDVDKAQQLAMVKVNEAKQLDTVEAKKAKRDLALKLTGGIGGGMALLLEILHRLGAL